MTTEQHTWGAPQPPKQEPRWTRGKALAAAMIALAIALVGGFAVYASTGQPTQRATGMTPNGGNVGFGSPMDALHGEFVVSDGNGGYETRRMQQGEVTKVSDSSITLESEDGYTRTYVIDSATRTQGDPRTGSTTQVIATVPDGSDGSAGKATAIIIAPTGDRQGMPGGGPVQPPGNPS